MATYVPAKKNTAFVTYVGLPSYVNALVLQANPTLAAGDVKVAIDDGAPANLATLPVVDGDFTKRVKVSLSAAEMNGDNITVIFSDAAGDEWCDVIINIQTVANQIDDLDTILDTIATDTTTEIPALIATAQADLDIITGATGVNLLTATQASIDAIETDTGTTIPGTITTMQGNVTDILADTDELQADWANGGRLDLIQDAILADTDELQTDWAVGGRLSTVLGNISGIDLFDAGKGTYNYPESLLDEVIDAQGDRDFSDGNIGNWVVSNGGGSGTLVYDATALGFAGESGDDKQAMLTSDTDASLYAALNVGTYASLTANKLHRMSAKVAVPAGNTNKNAHIQTSGMTQSNSVTQAITGDTWEVVTLYFYVDADVNGTLYIGFLGNPADTDKMYIDDITITPVDTSWVPYGGNLLALDETNDLFTITYSDADYGAYLNLSDATDFSRDLVVTRSYRVTVYDAQAVNGDVKISVVEVGDTELGSVTLTGDAAPITATFDFTASHATTNRIQLAGIAATESVKFSAMTVRENICSHCFTVIEDRLDTIDTEVGDCLTLGQFMGLK